MKSALTKLAGMRNYSMSKAEELIKASEAAQGQPVHVDMKKREIKVGNDVAFSQNKQEKGGSFQGAFSGLELP